MVYHIHTETPDGVSVEALTRNSVAEAYDHCIARLKENPSAEAIHLYVGERRIHTVARRVAQFG